MIKHNPDPVDLYIGTMLRYWRMQRVLSQSDLAAVLGLSVSEIKKYETARRRISTATLVKIGKALNVPVIEFLPTNPGDPWVAG